MARRFPWRGGRNRPQWLIYNAFMRKSSQSDSNVVAQPSPPPQLAPMPPILPVKREWRAAELEAAGEPRPN